MKLVILTSHPIQYQVPFFRALSSVNFIDLQIYFEEKRGVENARYDTEFDKDIKWDIPLLDGYSYTFLSGAISLIRCLKKDKPDALLLLGWFRPINWVAWVAAPMLGIKLCLRSESPLNQELGKGSLKRFIKGSLLRIFFSRIDAFLYIGEENKKFYRYYGVSDESLFFTPYAVDNERFMQAHRELSPGRSGLREALEIKQNDVLVLFVGKLIHKKRPMTLLRAYRKLIKRTTHNAQRIHLMYVGSGELERELKEYVEGHGLEHVHFIGFKNQTELPEYYELADIFVLPSGAGETWGLVANEAMCFGLPIVLSDMVGSAPDLVHEGENGYTFPLDDADALVEKLMLLAANQEMRGRLGRQSPKIVQTYSYERGIEGIVSALKSCKD